jgi:hypothetical protein
MLIPKAKRCFEETVNSKGSKVMLQISFANPSKETVMG